MSDDCNAISDERELPEQLHSATASTQQQEPPQSIVQRPDALVDKRSTTSDDCITISDNRDRPEQSHPTATETPAPTQSDRDRPESERPEQFSTQTASPPAPSPRSPSDFPEWMTAKQAFEAIGGDPGDRNSSVSSADGGKEIKFSTFKSKTSSELKPFGLKLNQDRKRRRQPCYRLLKKL